MFTKLKIYIAKKIFSSKNLYVMCTPCHVPYYGTIVTIYFRQCEVMWFSLKHSPSTKMETNNVS